MYRQLEHDIIELFLVDFRFQLNSIAIYESSLSLSIDSCLMVVVKWKEKKNC